MVKRTNFIGKNNKFLLFSSFFNVKIKLLPLKTVRLSLFSMFLPMFAVNICQFNQFFIK